MAGSALMLVLGFLIAVAVIVFLSNAAPTKPTGGGGGMPAVDVAASGSPQASVAAGMDMGGAAGAGGSTGAAGSAAGTGAGAVAAQTYAPASSSNKDTLRSGETLAEGASLTSKNGKYVFTYEYGAAVVKSGNFTMWTSPGNLTPGGVVKITADGNIGIFSSQYSVTPSGWSSATAGQGTQPYSLVMKDDGRLLLYDSSPMVIWSAPVTMPPVGVDCLMGSWGEWSACSKNCGGGVQTRNRSIITPSNTGGKACGETVETRPCNTDPCPDCAFTWTPFGQCVTQNPATGAGKKQSTLIVSSPSGPGGSVCPDPNSNIADCVNCVFSPWDPAGELSAQACNQTTGLKTQSRTITVPASGGGTCTEPLNRQEACAVDCQLNPWPETWSACENKVNGVGKNTRTTTVKFQPKNGGKACTTASGVLSGTQTCDANGNCTETRSCGDCVLGTTYTYGNCDPATGRASRTRVGDVAPSNGGTSCPGVTDEVNCDIDCKVSGWSEWTPAECGAADANRGRTRSVEQRKWNNGAECPVLTETQACPVVNCVQTAKVYSACDRSRGKKPWTRTTTTPAKNGGTACEPTSGEDDCERDANCTWGPCSRACNGTRSVSVAVIPEANGGKTCAQQVQENPRQTQECNTDANSCGATAWQEKNATGLNAKFYGKRMATDIGMVNDRVRAIDIPDGVGAVVHENGLGLSDGNVGYLSAGRWVSDSWWENRISGLRAYKIPDPPAGTGQYGGAQNKQLASTNDAAILTAYNGLTEAECANRCDYTNGCVSYISEQTGSKNCYILNNTPNSLLNNTNFNMKTRSGTSTQGVNKCHIFDQRAKAGWAEGSGWQFDRNKWKGTSAYDKASDDPDVFCTFR